MIKSKDIEKLIVTNNQKILFNNYQLDQELFYDSYDKERRMTDLESSDLNYLYENNRIEVQGLNNIDLNKRYLFSTFHLGSVFSIPFLLAKLNFEFYCIVGQSSENNSHLYKSLWQNLNLKNEFKYINIQEKNSFIKLIKQKKSHYSYFSYLDGNLGHLDFNDSKNAISINVLNKDILVRKGLPYLSYKLNLPIVPIYSFREQNKIIIKIYPPLNQESKNIDEYIEYCLNFCWKEFEKKLKLYPSQWENLKYPIPLRLKNDNEENKYVFNSHLYMLYNKNDKYYLINTEKYTLSEINKSIYTFLDYIKLNNLKLEKDDFDYYISNKYILNFLIDNKIIV